jgi:hypothetical protein
MGKRHPNPRLAKIHHSYSVEEIARLFAVHKNTVRSWLRAGLKPVDEERPTLVQGAELRRFLSERRKAAKQPCGPGRIYCLPCRAPMSPAGHMAECVLTRETVGRLQGICPRCDRMIYRRVNPQRLAEVKGNLDITVTQAAPRLEDTKKPHVTCDLSGASHP